MFQLCGCIYCKNVCVLFFFFVLRGVSAGSVVTCTLLCVWLHYPPGLLCGCDTDIACVYSVYSVFTSV